KKYARGGLRPARPFRLFAVLPQFSNSPISQFSNSPIPQFANYNALTPMLSCQRARFSLPPDLHYLNCAYMGPSPISVQEAGAAAIRRKGNPSEIVAADFFEGSEELRRLFGRLINADPARVAIIPAV